MLAMRLSLTAPIVYLGPSIMPKKDPQCVVRAQLYMPPTGFVNNCDGGRSHTYCDYRQQ